ncbi:hypothetical protein HGM15179_013864, partial [Zosterops borbonicus]
MAPGLSASPPVVVLLLSLLGLAAAGKLLVVPVDGSHWLSMREVLDILHQKGHEVVVVAPEVTMHIKPSENFVMKRHSVPYTQEEMERDFKAFLQTSFEEGSFVERFLKVYEGMKKFREMSAACCQELLQNKELIRYLEESKFDALLTDPVVPCGVILAEHLSLPSVYFLRGIPCGLDFEATQCPNPPSYVPRAFSQLTDRMSFLQRVKNLLFDTQNLFLCDFAYNPFSKLASEFLQREVTVQDLLRKGSVWLLRLEFVLDYPRPLMPNIIPIGGVHCAHKGLSQEEMEKGFKAFFQVSFEEGLFFERFLKVYKGMKRITEFGVSSCEHLLQNKELIRYLEESKFDAILTDPFIPCGAILAEHLSLPSMYFLRGIPCGLDFDATQCPKPPSYVPRVFTHLSDRMSFLQRVKNLLFDIPNVFLCDLAFQPYSKLASEFLQREVTVLDLLRKGSVWLLRLEFVLDYPRPLMPNIIPIGGVNCAHKELPRSLTGTEGFGFGYSFSYDASFGVLWMLARALSSVPPREPPLLIQWRAWELGALVLLRVSFAGGTGLIPAGMAPGLSASPLVVVLLLSLLGLAAAGKLLVVPVDGSHWLSMRKVLDMLQQKGHKGLAVTPEVTVHIKPSENFVMKRHSGT